MWKIIVAALSGATLATILVASCLDRDEDASLEEPGITQVTSTEMPAGGAATASATDTSSGLGGDHGAAGVPADLPRNAGETPAEPASNDSSTGAPPSRAPVLVERVENMSVNVTNMSTQPAPGDASNVGGVPPPIFWNPPGPYITPPSAPSPTTPMVQPMR